MNVEYHNMSWCTNQVAYIYVISRPRIYKSPTSARGLPLAVSTFKTPNFDDSVPSHLSRQWQRCPCDNSMGRVFSVPAITIKLLDSQNGLLLISTALRITAFTPQPSGLVGGVVTVQAGERLPDLRNHISVTAWRIFSVRSSVELSWPVVVHCHGHWFICPIWASHGPKTCQICSKLGPNFAERISLKPLDGFTQFKVLWTCLDL